MAYVSDETGRNEVYVQEFPKPRRKYRVSTDGASRAWWRQDRRQLLLLSTDQTLTLVADVQSVGEFSITRPRVVGRLSGQIVAIDATPDLRRLLAVVNDGASATRSLTVVQNWTAALSR